MKIPLLLLLTIISVSPQTFAQDTPTRTCRILFVDRPADAPKSLHLFDGTSSQEVDLPSMNFSAVYTLASGPIQLKLLPAKFDPANPPAKDAPTVEIPKETTHFLLLVSSDPENKVAPVKLEAINLENEEFKIGQTLWFNRTDSTIEATLGDRTLSLDPHSSKMIDGPTTGEGKVASGYFKASFSHKIQPQDAFTPITEQQWWYDANSRHLGFVENSGGKLPRIYFFRDFRTPE